jgi:hypothetical protein
MLSRAASRSLGSAPLVLLPLVLAAAASASEPRWTDSPSIAIVGSHAVAGNGGWLSESGSVDKYVFRFTRNGVVVRGPDSVPKTTPSDVVPANTYPDVSDANFYALQAADLGRRICVEVWGGTHSIHYTSDGQLAYDVWEWGHVNAAGEPAIACTTVGGVPQPPPPGPPVVTPPTTSSTPTVSGTPMVEETLTASAGTWNGTPPLTRVVRWERCDAAGASCTDAGVAGETYTVIPYDIGKRLRVAVTMSNPAGTQTARSDLTAVVSELRPTPERTWIPAAKVTAPHKLVIDGVEVTPRRVTRRGPVKATVRVTDDRGFTISGALVTAVALPAGSLAVPADVETGQDGRATLTFGPGTKARVPRRAFITLVLTARRPGDRHISPRSATVRVRVPVARTVKPEG